jgi:hypothetical protein
MKKIGGRPEGGAQVSIARTMQLAGRFPHAPACSPLLKEQFWCRRRVVWIDGNPCVAELRSRVTQALDARELAVRQDPTNGQKWWDLGVEAQVAAGGSVQEEVGAARMLERAMMLQPRLDKT